MSATVQVSSPASVTLKVATSVEEAVHELGQGARAVAGGTDLVVGARQGKAPLPEHLVAIHGLAELRTTHQTDGTLHMGALTTHAQLAADPTVQRRLTALADACAIVGSHATRAFGTIGGNLMNASPAMETGGPLLCFDAKVRLRSTSGTRTLGVDDLLEGPGQTTALPGELLEEVEVPLPPEEIGSPSAAQGIGSSSAAQGIGSCYLRLEYRRQMEIAVVGATAVLGFDGGRVNHARVAITALAPTIRRVAGAEEALLGSDGGPEAARAASEQVADASKPISDVRASADYRSAMAAVIGRRAIEVAAARARGQQVPIPASPALHGGLR